jgi:acetyl esterase/lipase
MAGNNKSSGPNGTRGLVAPELLPVLEVLPDQEFNERSLPAIRAGTALGPGATPGPGTTSAPPRGQPPLTPAQQTVTCERRLVPGPPGAPDVRVLAYTPSGKNTSTGRPAYLHMHGGGFVIGTPEINDAANRSIASQLNCVIVSVDYRLAPETRFPGALEDCYTAFRWLVAQADQLGVDRSRIAIGGESAGAGHAAALAIHLRDHGGARICLQLLDSPMLDDRTGSTAGPHPYCGEFIWTANSNRFGWASLLGVAPGGADVPPGAVPARVADLTGLPPAFITVGALDLFLEEDLEYARRLIRAGVPTELHVIPGAFHGFGAAGGSAPQVEGCLRLRREALARAFQQAGA